MTERRKENTAMDDPKLTSAGESTTGTIKDRVDIDHGEGIEKDRTFSKPPSKGESNVHGGTNKLKEAAKRTAGKSSV